MTFEERLSVCARQVEERLGRELDENAANGSGVPERLISGMQYAVMSGGKRIRPFLLIESTSVFGVDRARAIPAALALELVHCYSLVHDDLPAMDNDELRRGRPSVWKAYDDWTAILVGDALLTLAFETLAKSGVEGPATKMAKLVAGLAKAAGAGGMVGGQCLDLEADKLGRPQHLTDDHVRRLQGMKTGALFQFACQAGAIVAGASVEHEKALARFGDRLGAAFQLADDLLDAEGDPATVGKATGKDAAAGKATLVGLLGVERAKRKLDEIKASALSEIEGFGKRADVLRDALRFAVNRLS